MDMDVERANQWLDLWRLAQKLIPDLERILMDSQELELDAFTLDIRKALRAFRLADSGMELVLIKSGVVHADRLTREAKELGVVDPREEGAVRPRHNSIAYAGSSGYVIVTPGPDGPRRKRYPPDNAPEESVR